MERRGNGEMGERTVRNHRRAPAATAALECGGPHRFPRRTQAALLAAAPTLAALTLAGSLWLAHRETKVYTHRGLGGYEASLPGSAGILPARARPAQPALDAYNAGRYPEAEAAARELVARAKTQADPQLREEALRAQWVLAFSAARRKDYATARARFAALQSHAKAQRREGGRGAGTGGSSPSSSRTLNAQRSTLNSRGPTLDPQPGIGETPATLEEEGAYQHAVLTGALGDRKAAEAEFRGFMRAYPESPLVHAAVQRIGRFHGGDVPKDAEAEWQQAMKTVQAREKARAREQAMCGPECLAELERRSASRKDAKAQRGEESIGPIVRTLNSQLSTPSPASSAPATAAPPCPRWQRPPGAAAGKRPGWR